MLQHLRILLFQCCIDLHLFQEVSLAALSLK